MEKKKNIFYVFIVSAAVFAVHFITAVFLKKAVKYAVFSEAVGIAAAFAFTGAVMLLLYFMGRRIIISKELLTLKCYFVISAVVPPVVWLAASAVKCVSFVNSTDFNAIISEPELWDIICCAVKFLGTVNSFISLLSSAMMLVIAGIFEIINILITTLRKRVGKN